MKHWAHLRYSPCFVQAALCVSTPCLLEEVRNTVEQCSRDSEVKLLEGLGITWGLEFCDHPGLVRKNQVTALRPYLRLLPGTDIASLWHACNSREWFDMRREMVDEHLQPPYPIGKWDPRQAMSHLDKMLGERHPMFLNGWVNDLLRSGVIWTDIFRVMTEWLGTRRSLRAIECVAAAVRTFGLRADLVTIESFKNLAPPRSLEIIEDTKFAVQRRSIL